MPSTTRSEPAESAREVSVQVATRLKKLAAQPISRWTTPLDLAGHRHHVDRYLEEGRSIYRERFVYEPFPFDEHLSATHQLVPLADQVDPRLRHLLGDELGRRADRCAAHATADDDVISQALATLDGLPSTPLVQEAERILARPVEPDEPAMITSAEAAGRVEERLTQVEVPGWRVELADNLAASMTVNGPRKLLRIRRSATFSEPMVRRLLVHEIDGHVARWEAAQRQPEPLAAIPMGRTVPTEEGLALWREQQAGVLSPHMMRTYAARVIAVDHARDNGLLAVVRRLLDHNLPRVAAIDVALRTKRSLHDPNGPGGTTKDWGYLGGLHLINEVAAADLADVHRLAQVKWATEQLPVIRELLG